ncbi:hypothetical protein D5366_00450 [Neokomagataea tanensis]|uniref:Uncharacterized protein n=1 Tax=Neokomagataea tanensis TaxID=661191 RepID=A0A4Y6V530_9PROT|nr:hypothetical protein D5366_00450 [Neokomagataea tanensis]
MAQHRRLRIDADNLLLFLELTRPESALIVRPRTNLASTVGCFEHLMVGLNTRKAHHGEAP